MLVEAGRVAIEQNRRVAEAFACRRVFIPPFSPLPAAPPLCFLHIPKTGGASVIEWLESNFAAGELAPCRNAPDFERLWGREHAYRLFAGHFLGRQAELFPADAQWITILRDPVEMTVSASHHRRLAPPEDWERDRAALAHGASLRGDDDLDRCRAKNVGALLREMDLPAALRARPTLLRPFFRDVLLRRLAATEPEDARVPELDDDDHELAAIRAEQWPRAVRRLETMDVVGDYARQDEFLLLAAATRGWAAPPPLVRIHDFGAPTRADAADPELRAVLDAYSPHDQPLYALAQRRADAIRDRLTDLCGGPDAGHVNAHHRRQVFAALPPTVAFDVTADEAWSGCGWGLRERDGLGNAYRKFADRRSASFLARLDLSVPEYRLFVHVWDAGSEAILRGLGAEVGGARLERVDAAWRDGALIVEWRLPGVLTLPEDGNLEVVFTTPAATQGDTLALARIGCVPAC